MNCVDLCGENDKGIASFGFWDDVLLCLYSCLREWEEAWPFMTMASQSHEHQVVPGQW